MQRAPQRPSSLAIRLGIPLALGTLLVAGAQSVGAEEQLDENQGQAITCPDEGSGIDGEWHKEDRDSGEMTGAFGSFRWSDDTLAWDLDDGYMLEFCIRHGRDGTGAPPDDPDEMAAQFRFTTGGVTGDGAVSTPNGKNISHMSWRVVDEPNGDDNGGGDNGNGNDDDNSGNGGNGGGGGSSTPDDDEPVVLGETLVEEAPEVLAETLATTGTTTTLILAVVGLMAIGGGAALVRRSRLMT